MLKSTKFGAKRLVAAASSLALVGGLAVAAPAAANGGGYQEPLENATFSWKISPCAFDVAHANACASLQQKQAVSGNVTKGNEGWTFTKGTGFRDVASGDTTVNYQGTITLSNTNRGQYVIKISNPTLTTSGTEGTLKADVQYLLPKENNDPTNGYFSSQVKTLKVLELQNVSSANNTIAAASATPDAPSGDYSATPGFAGFDADFTDFLATAANMEDGAGNPVPGRTSLTPWFTMTANGTSNTAGNDRKVAFPISATVQVAPPKLELVGAAGIPLNKARTVTVKGSGFDPALRTAGLYVAFGPNADQVDKQDIGNVDAFYSAVPLFGAFPNASGQFETTLDVTGIYKSNQGKNYDGRSTALGVSVWAAHTDSVASYRQFTKIDFAPAITTFTKPGKVAGLKRKVNKKKTKATFTWAAPVATKAEFANNAAVRYQVRVTNYKGKFGKWKYTTKRSLSVNTKRKGTYKIQVRAIGKAGTGSYKALSYKKR